MNNTVSFRHSITMNGDIMGLLNSDKVKLYNAVGIITGIIVEDEYKICPDCGRIYTNKKGINYCTQCVGKPLKTLKIKIE